MSSGSGLLLHRGSPGLFCSGGSEVIRAKTASPEHLTFPAWRRLRRVCSEGSGQLGKSAVKKHTWLSCVGGREKNEKKGKSFSPLPGTTERNPEDCRRDSEQASSGSLPQVGTPRNGGLAGFSSDRQAHRNWTGCGQHYLTGIGSLVRSTHSAT